MVANGEDQSCKLLELLDAPVVGAQRSFHRPTTRWQQTRQAGGAVERLESEHGVDLRSGANP